MNEQEVWQRLRLLESFDNVQNWYKIIHKRELSSRRTNEIICAAKQAREYFKNAKQSDYSVRSLLAFYGIACLSRSVTLLVKNGGGEESLTKGHGLQVDAWGSILSGEISQAISKIGNLQIETCSGLFNDFIESTNNILCLHVIGSTVDGRISYSKPVLGVKISFIELLSRIPDLKNEMEIITPACYANVEEITCSKNSGFKIGCVHNPPQTLLEYYRGNGYLWESTRGNNYSMTGSADLFDHNTPLFLHKYMDKMFGTIPRLNIIEPLECRQNYSEMGFCYLVSYFMGMLSRYYPTHWVSLINGSKGDFMWPVVNRAQSYVETVFPELIVEFIQECLKTEK